MSLINTIMMILCGASVIISGLTILAHVSLYRRHHQEIFIVLAAVGYGFLVFFALNMIVIAFNP